MVSSGKLFASTLSTFNIQDYTEIVFKVSKVKDTRQNKYAPKREVTDIEVPAIMGTRSLQTLLKRSEYFYSQDKLNYIIR